jgi:hypothetical protein
VFLSVYLPKPKDYEATYDGYDDWNGQVVDYVFFHSYNAQAKLTLAV